MTKTENLDNQIERLEKYVADVEAATGADSAETADALDILVDLLAKNQIRLDVADKLKARSSGIRMAIKNVKAVTQSSHVDKQDTRECPYCAEVIKVKAKLCKYCKSELNGELTQQTTHTLSEARHKPHVTVEASSLVAGRGVSGSDINDIPHSPLFTPTSVQNMEKSFWGGIGNFILGSFLLLFFVICPPAIAVYLVVAILCQASNKEYGDRMFGRFGWACVAFVIWGMIIVAAIVGGLRWASNLPDHRPKVYTAQPEPVMRPEDFVSHPNQGDPLPDYDPATITSTTTADVNANLDSPTTGESDAPIVDIPPAQNPLGLKAGVPQLDTIEETSTSTDYGLPEPQRKGGWHIKE